MTCLEPRSLCGTRPFLSNVFGAVLLFLCGSERCAIFFVGKKHIRFTSSDFDFFECCCGQEHVVRVVQNSGNFSWPVDVVVLSRQPCEDLQRCPSICCSWCSAPVSLSLFCPLSDTAQAHAISFVRSTKVFGVSCGIYPGYTLEQNYSVWIARSFLVTYRGGKYSVWIEGSILRCCNSPSVGKRVKTREPRRSASEGQQLAGHGDRIQGRSCHEESLFHMAEHIPEGTNERRHGTFPVGSTDSGRGTGTCTNDAASCGCNDHEIRLDPG